jgi:hypothetical protein
MARLVAVCGDMADKPITVHEAGRKGGNSRAERQTPEQRSALARKAAQARWAKARKRKPKA